MLFPAALLAQPAGKKELVGVWAVREAQVGQSQRPVLSLVMFRGDGSFIKCVGYKALPAIAALQEVATELGPGYGRWAATGDAGEVSKEGDHQPGQLVRRHARLLLQAFDGSEQRPIRALEFQILRR